MAAYVMGGFTLLSCLVALLGILPRVTSWSRGQRSPARVANPFFFGDFDRISGEDYLTAWLTSWPRTLYRTIALDIYRQGCVLQRKYR